MLEGKSTWEDKRKERNYLNRINLDYTRVWCRYRSKMTIRVKENWSSEFKTNMDRRHCNTKEEESQKHLEICKGRRLEGKHQYQNRK